MNEAFEKYKLSEGYKNLLTWLHEEGRVDEVLQSIFLAGWRAAEQHQIEIDEFWDWAKDKVKEAFPDKNKLNEILGEIEV